MSVKGGDKLAKHLNRIAERIGKANSVRVGFLEGATYPAKGKKDVVLSVATVAFLNNFGTSKARARPFFSDMIREETPTLGKKVEAAMKANDYDADAVLNLVGTYLKDKLVQKIVEWPADNAPSTVAKKGFNKGLIDKGVMQRSVDFEVTE